MRHLFAVLLLTMPLMVVAQTAATKEFPADAIAISPETLKERLSGKVFMLNWVGANAWRLDFRGNGYVYFNSGGTSASGTWRTEEGKVCTNVGNFGANCNEVRESAGQLYYKRQSGEVVQLTAQ